jgi:hypothetical protein
VNSEIQGNTVDSCSDDGISGDKYPGTDPELMSEYTGFSRSSDLPDSSQNPAGTYEPKILEK